MNPFFITKNGYSDMLIMSMDTYEQSLANVGLYDLLAKSFGDEKLVGIEKARAALAEIRQEYAL